MSFLVMYSLGNYPNLVILQLIPKIALAPLFVVWLGISSESRVAFAAFVSFFPVVISAAVGFSNIEASGEVTKLVIWSTATPRSWRTGKHRSRVGSRRGRQGPRSRSRRRTRNRW